MNYPAAPAPSREAYAAMTAAQVKHRAEQQAGAPREPTLLERVLGCQHMHADQLDQIRKRLHVLAERLLPRQEQEKQPTDSPPAIPEIGGPMLERFAHTDDRIRRVTQDIIDVVYALERL